MEEEYHEVYCKHCNSCGEEGCCNPLHCAHHCMIESGNGLHCGRNYYSIEMGYRMGIELYEMFHDHEGVDELWNKIYDEVYGEEEIDENS